jgi:hypothetical protein
MLMEMEVWRKSSRGSMLRRRIMSDIHDKKRQATHNHGF